MYFFFFLDTWLLVDMEHISSSQEVSFKLPPLTLTEQSQVWSQNGRSGAGYKSDFFPPLKGCKSSQKNHLVASWRSEVFLYKRKSVLFIFCFVLLMLGILPGPYWLSLCYILIDALMCLLKTNSVLHGCFRLSPSRLPSHGATGHPRSQLVLQVCKAEKVWDLPARDEV